MEDGPLLFFGISDNNKRIKVDLSPNTTTFVVLLASIVAAGGEMILPDFSSVLNHLAKPNQLQRERERERKRDSMSWPVTHGDLFVVRHALNCCSLESLSDGDDGLEL